MSETTNRLGQYLVQCMTIDSRSLALFRIAIGLLIIGDVLARASTFGLFYTEDGVVPQVLAESRTVDGAFSFFYFTQDSTVIALLFLIHAIVAIQLIIGYKTTFAMILSFLFVISLDHHNPLVLSHADTLFRLITFWAIFLPLGERWSVDALQRDRDPRPQIASLGTAAILIQIVHMYTLNGFYKVTGEHWNTGEATPLIFGLDDMTYFLAEPMRQFPLMLEVLGTIWYFMLLISILLIFLLGRVRVGLALMFFMAHFSFTVTVRIGSFGWIAMGAILLFLPTVFWDDLQSIVRRLGLQNRLVDPVHRALTSFGTRAASSLPPLRPPITIPDSVRVSAYDIGVSFLIMAILVFPTLWIMADEGIINRATTTVEARVESEFRKIGVRQSNWTVFAPSPRTVDRYYVFPARTVDGELLDVFNDRPLSFERPYEQLHKMYPNYRQRFYMNTIRSAGQSSAPVDFYVDWICRDYASRGIELTQINLAVVHETVTLETIDDFENRETRRQLLAVDACPGYEPEQIDLPDQLS
jgi:hypothetical protein